MVRSSLRMSNFATLTSGPRLLTLSECVSNVRGSTYNENSGDSAAIIVTNVDGEATKTATPLSTPSRCFHRMEVIHMTDQCGVDLYGFLFEMGAAEFLRTFQHLLLLELDAMPKAG
jgi:hypothetical protein